MHVREVCQEKCSGSLTVHERAYVNLMQRTFSGLAMLLAEYTSDATVSARQATSNTAQPFAPLAKLQSPQTADEEKTKQLYLEKIEMKVVQKVACPKGSVAIVGDSLTVGLGRNNTYPAMLEEKLRQYCPTVRVQSDDGNPSTTQGIPKAGVRGDKYAHNGKTTASMKKDFDTVLAGGHNEVIILGGGNDLAGGVHAQKIRENLSDMYARAKQKGMRVIAVTTTPWKGYAPLSSVGWSEKKFKQQRELNAWIHSKPTNVDVVVDAYDALENRLDPGALMSAAQSVDKIHPGVPGLHMIAEKIFNTAYTQCEHHRQ